MGQEGGHCLQVPERMGEGVFQGRKTRLPCSGAAAALQKWARNPESVYVLGIKKNKGSGSPCTRRRVEGLGVPVSPPRRVSPSLQYSGLESY